MDDFLLNPLKKFEMAWRNLFLRILIILWQIKMKSIFVLDVFFNLLQGSLFSHART